MRTTLFITLFLFAAAALSEEWIEFQPPMMDDVTVDPLRFKQHGEPFDLSAPVFRPVQHGQSAKATRSGKTTKDKLVFDCEFTGKGNLEYLEIQTNIKVEKPGLHLGGVFSTDLSKLGTIRMRLRDPSGEIHQHTLGTPSRATGAKAGDIGAGDVGAGGASPPVPIFAEIDTARDGSWGGDGDKKLQFPCEIVSILLDKPEVGFVGKGTLEVTNLALYEAVELRDALKIEFAADSPPGLLFETPGTIKWRLLPKNLKEGEEVFVYFPQVRIRQSFPPADTPVRLTSELTSGDTREITVIRVPLASQTSLPFQMPVDTPLAHRVVITGYVQNADGEKFNILPVSFSYGSIKPNMPQDDRLGVCTHYQQGWNTNSLDFAVKAGFGMIRDEMSWGSVERGKGVLTVPNYGTYIDLAREKNLEPLLILNYSNRHYDNNSFPHSDEAITAFANYGKFVAENFRGRIKYYEIWNEWFIACGMRHAQDSGHNTAENYVKLLKATYEAVKSVDPDAYIVGGGGDHPFVHRKQMEELFKLGVHNYCDAFSIHPYRQPRTPEESGLVEEVLSFAEMMKQHGVAKPKLWITEIGWPTPKKHPAKDAELFQAAMVVRSAVPMLALGCVEKFIWYDLKNDGTDRVDAEHNFGIIRNDRLGLQVKPAFVAFAVMSSNTAGREIVKDETLSKDGVHAYRLKKAGEPDRLVLWVAEGEKKVQLPGIASATNLFGTPLTFSSNEMTLSEEPIWVVVR